MVAEVGTGGRWSTGGAGRADRLDFKILAGVVTREISLKLKALGSYILEKNSETPEGLAMLTDTLAMIWDSFLCWDDPSGPPKSYWVDAANCDAFRLDKETGKKCYMIAARDLFIEWSDTPHHWKWSPSPESRFLEVAELIGVCWLQIVGNMHTSLLSAGTNYAVYLVFKMTEEAFGFHTAKKATTVRTAVGKTNTIEVLLEPNQGPLERLRLRLLGRFGFVPSRPAEEGDEKCPKRRSEGWLEQKLGEFSSNEEDDGEVEVSLLEISPNMKRGLLVEGIEFRPAVASSPGLVSFANVLHRSFGFLVNQ
ncbi:putative F-box protein PP2-B2 [Drosera capensis]